MKADVMSFRLMTNEQILKALGKQFEELRIHKSIQDKEIIKEGGIGKDAINKFRHHHGDINLTSLIKILRGLGELERLETIFKVYTQFSPTQQEKKQPKRVHKKRSNEFQWDDEA